MASVRTTTVAGHQLKCQNPLMMRCGPHCRANEIDGQVLQDEFHQIFRKSPEKKKSKKKKNPKNKEKKRKADPVERQPIPFPEIRSNPSAFAVFACVRRCVLDEQVKEATRVYLRTSLGGAGGSQRSDTDSDEEETGKAKDTLIKVPKVVGIGLCSVFELIKESRKRHPNLCTRALQALLDMLQGQQPEGLKTEPSEVIDALFDLLLEIACSSPASTEPSPSGFGLPMSYAAACLISLVVARGDTGKLLSATAAMLMSPRTHVAEEIPMPAIIVSLQRSIHAVLLGKTHGPDWSTHGIPKTSLCDTFYLQIPKLKNVSSVSAVSDGKYLYLLCGSSMYKVGTGFGGTIKGEIVSYRGGLQGGDHPWLGFAKGHLYVHSNFGRGNEMIKLDRETLEEKELVQLDVTDCGPSAYFSDGEHLGVITAGKDDGFVVRTFKTGVSPMPCVHELTLKLARKSLEVFGSGIFDEESTHHALCFPLSEDEPTMLSCGKDFALLRTSSGKVLVSGKPQSLGIKQGGRVGSKWTDVPITKSPKIVQLSVGHEGLHALLVSEDGGVFFCGLARRGEDGDQTKGRRQPKPVKPKKMIKMEGRRIIASACNNGTSALVTQEGELYLFGKDGAHADHNTGLVTDLKDAIVTQVALGKAHVVALSNKGHVYTFGINHKGQCGREFSHGALGKEAVHSVAMATAPEEEEEEDGESEDQDLTCPPGKHRWKHDQCMVCTLCGECTGYGAGCIASGRPERNPGQFVSKTPKETRTLSILFLKHSYLIFKIRFSLNLFLLTTFQT